MTIVVAAYIELFYTQQIGQCGTSEAERHLGITLSIVCLSVHLYVRPSVRPSIFWFADNFQTVNPFKN